MYTEIRSETDHSVNTDDYNTRDTGDEEQSDESHAQPQAEYGCRSTPVDNSHQHAWRTSRNPYAAKEEEEVVTECDGNVEYEKDHGDNLEEEHLDDDFDVDDIHIYCFLHVCVVLIQAGPIGHGASTEESRIFISCASLCCLSRH